MRLRNNSRFLDPAIKLVPIPQPIQLHNHSNKNHSRFSNSGFRISNFEFAKSHPAGMACRRLFHVINLGWPPTSSCRRSIPSSINLLGPRCFTSNLSAGSRFGGTTFSGKCRDGGDFFRWRVRNRGCNGVRVGFGCRSAMGSGFEAPSVSAKGFDAELLAKTRRFAVLTTGHAAEYCVAKYGGYGPMFITMLSEPGEEWDEYYVVEGQFPSPEELHKYDGFVVTGSRHDAHGDEEWIAKLCDILQQLHEMKKKSLCVCFGHQVLSRALGGKTGRASVGWEVGLRDICLTDAFFSKPYAVGMPPILKVLEVHRDQVSEIPPGAELLASSERTGVEMFALEEHVLAIQGHPEFFDDVVFDLIDGRLASMMTEEERKLSKESLLKACADQKAWQQLCKDFLKGSKK